MIAENVSSLRIGTLLESIFSDVESYADKENRKRFIILSPHKTLQDLEFGSYLRTGEEPYSSYQIIKYEVNDLTQPENIFSLTLTEVKTSDCEETEYTMVFSANPENPNLNQLPPIFRGHPKCSIRQGNGYLILTDLNNDSETPISEELFKELHVTIFFLFSIRS